MQPSRSASFERRSSANRRQPTPAPIPSTPRGRIPSPSPSPSPSRDRPLSSRGRPASRTRSLSAHQASRSRSRPRSKSPSSSRSPSRRSRRNGDNRHHGIFKTTAGLLAGIGVATVVAHKVWPKGILHGDREDWQSRPHAKHHHQRRHRSPDSGERVVERVARRHGDVVYCDEVRRRPQNYERMPRPEHDMMRHPSERLPYIPDDPYFSHQPFYKTERRRTVVQQVPVPR
ncbi:hypothetical protein F66182_9941 [Fusarium sp. NRRL 66182]|nr:hypothetical protein F66182_9941 [Fusarium sp. NRRL 66182]